MAASSSSSSMTIDAFTYDVFLSFRGPDTRYDFTGNLWKALEVRGIHTFIDKEDVPKGEEISDSLLQAIKQSRTAIVVLSPTYASSAFCLDELSHILEHIKGKGRLVWPIFYEVEPSDVRWSEEEGTCGKAMAEHEATSWYNTDRLRKWKRALHEVANKSGTYFETGGGYQYRFIEKIVEEVSKKIKPFTLYVADDLVGLETPKKEVISLLNVGSDDEVHMVGIHGIGGIGKTTLSLAVYNSIADQFDGSCYLERVRENSERHMLTHLQKKLLYDIVGEKKIKLASVDTGITIIQQKLRQKKVLLILDDVDKVEQLKAIVGEPKWFGRGSRVIITTRDKGLLTSHGVKRTYEMKELNKKDALKLLKLKAFETKKVSPDYVDVLNRVVTYASGLPLALTVIGSHLYKKKTIDDCKSTLDCYERTPNKAILTILKVSFDALSEEEKNVFLDIACCFKGHKLTNVEKILHAHHGYSIKHHISELVEKSLIKINESGDVTLHDLIEDMGKEIVRQESPKEPGRRSRLWSPEDIVQVLKNNTGTSENEIICLNSWIEVECDGQAFKKMENLKTLIIRCDRFYEYPKHLPNSLRVLQWHCFSTGSYLASSSLVLPFDSHPTKLVICEIDYGNSPSIVCRNLFKKKFENMRVLEINSCSLTHIGDISGLPNLEEISFRNWLDLTTIDDSIGLLDKLKILRVHNCYKLKSLPPLKLPSLEKLIIFACYILESVPSMDRTWDKLKILKVKYCYRLESIPPMYGLLGKLKILRVYKCNTLRNIPPLKLPSLEELNISHCDSLLSIPRLNLPSLVELNISHCDSLLSISPLNLPSLEELNISHCDCLSSISLVEDESLGKLKILSVKACKKLTSIPPLKCPSLEKLKLKTLDSLESIAPMDMSMGKLKFLSLEGCRKLTSIPSLELPLLEQLNLSYCDHLESFPEILGVTKNITEFSMAYTPIKKIPLSFQNLTRLQTLELLNCGIAQLPSSIVVMSELTKITMEESEGWLLSKQDKGEEKGSPMQSSQVEFINLKYCNLSEESLAIGLKWFANVKELNLRSSKFTILPKCIEQCQFLWKLDLNYCEELQEIKGIPPSLKTLSAVDCKSLASSCKSKLLNQELHEVGNTDFLLQLAEIPEWFGHHCRIRMSISFWFRNKFPAVALCFVSPLGLYYSRPPLRVIINGNTFFYTDYENHCGGCNLGEAHLHLFHMQMEKFNKNMDKAFSKNKWNRAKIDFEPQFKGSQFKACKIHVLKEQEEDDVKFTRP